MIMHNDGRVPVGVVGASGYTGGELLQVLGRHDGVTVALATSRSQAGEPTSVPGVTYQEPAADSLSGLDIVFLGLPHGAAGPWAEEARSRGARVIDLTADHRPGSERAASAAYGLTELNQDAVRASGLVANPGCYPTGVILALRPLLERGLLDLERPVVIHAASGTTGAGRAPRRDLLFSEVAGDYRTYALGNEHRHLAEMRASLPGAELLFVPHLLPVARGILETLAVPVAGGVGAGTVREAWLARYDGSPAVRILGDRAPSLRDVVCTDRVALHVTENGGLKAATLTVVVALDNLGKGAAGQAVQNMNVMVGFAPERGLRC